MYIKLHKSYRTVVAVADQELIGKKFEEGKRQLDIRENFYKGELIEEQKLIELMIKQRKEDATFNIVGQQSVSIAKKSGIITDDHISTVAGIPFALILI